MLYESITFWGPEYTLCELLLWRKIYPFMPIGISHPYQLNESISNLRVVG